MLFHSDVERACVCVCVNPWAKGSPPPPPFPPSPLSPPFPPRQGVSQAGGTGGADETGANKDTHQSPVIQLETSNCVPAEFFRKLSPQFSVVCFHGGFARYLPHKQVFPPQLSAACACRFAPLASGWRLSNLRNLCRGWIMRR